LRVLIADSDVMFRHYLSRILENQPGCHVVGETVDMKQTLEEFAKVNPDLVCVGISLPYHGGLEATRQIRRLRPSTRVILFSEAAGEAYQAAAIHAGADCLLLKNAEISVIVQTLRGMMQADSQRSA